FHNHPPPSRRRESGHRGSRGGQPEGPLPERAGTMRSAMGAPPRRPVRVNAYPLSGRGQARKDLSDDRRLTEPRQETPRSPRARQALTRPKETLLRCCLSSSSVGPRGARHGDPRRSAKGAPPRRQTRVKAQPALPGPGTPPRDLHVDRESRPRGATVDESSSAPSAHPPETNPPSLPVSSSSLLLTPESADARCPKRDGPR